MNFNDYEKTNLQTEFQKLIKDSTDFTNSDDCYCVLMKQIFLSKSTLN